MTTWKDRLRDADTALGHELSPPEAQRVKQTVLAAARAAHLRRWSLPFALTAGSLAAASLALVLATVMASPDSPPPGGQVDDIRQVPAKGLDAESGPRQLHFSTPGGTRIIWVFDADFEVKGTLP